MRAESTTPTTSHYKGRLLPLSAMDLQILLVLAGEDLYGYAIKKAVERESGGTLSPEIGSLYRILARLTDSGWAEEADAWCPDDGPHRGRPRRYYRITEKGIETARAELRRLERVVDRAPDLAQGRAR